MRKNVVLVMIAALAFFLLIGVFIVFSVNPNMQPAGWIKQDLLKLTPIGTSMEEVIAAVESNENWKIMSINEKNGYLAEGSSSVPGTEIFVGEKFVRASLEKHFMGVYVSAYYGFDENSELIDIKVVKSYDLL